MGIETIRIIGKEARPNTVRVVINSGYTHWVGDEKYTGGDEVEIPKSDYEQATRKFQLVEGGAEKPNRKVLRPQSNKAMNGQESNTETK